MKKMLGCMFSVLSMSAWAIDGVNYDPAHSRQYLDAQIANKLDIMKAEINTDLDLALQNGFTVLKTFYSGISTVDGKNTATMAELACPKGIKLMLGVYEFDPANDNCSNWCDLARKKQVDDAIASVQKYNINGQKCIVGIVVGNEDIYNWNFTQANSLVQQHIAADIKTIKAAVGTNVKVGTAQQDGALLKLADKDPNGILPQLDFIGANIYPFWSSNPFTPFASAQKEFMTRLEAVRAKFHGKKVVVTEEGWPSQGSGQQNPGASLENENSYYAWWKGRSDNFDSYYFSFFDKRATDGDADKFFGLCKADREAKVAGIICTH